MRWKRISDVRALRAHQFPEDAGPLAHPVRPELYHEINNFYTTTVYDKGGEIVRMIKRCWALKCSARAWTSTSTGYDGEAATVEHFVQCFADVTGPRFPQFMLWYTQAGTPSRDARRITMRARKTYRLDINKLSRRRRDSPKAADGHSARARTRRQARQRSAADPRLGPLKRAMLELTAPSQSFVFTGVAEPPIPSVTRGFSAPIKLTLPIKTHDLRFLAAHDRDPFNRWQTVQTLAMSLLTTSVAALRTGGAARSRRWAPSRCSARSWPTLRSSWPSSRSTLTPPSEPDIAREIGHDVHPDAIFAARKHLRAAIGGALGATLTTHLPATDDAPAPNRPDAEERRTARAEECLPRTFGGDRREQAIKLALHQYQ